MIKPINSTKVSFKNYLEVKVPPYIKDEPIRPKNSLKCTKPKSN